MRRIVLSCGYAVACAYTGAFWSSLVAQTLAGAAVMALVVAAALGYRF